MASSASFLIASQHTHSTNPQSSTFNEHHAAFSITLHCCECCLTTLTRPSKSKLKFVGEVSFQLVSRFIMETPNDRAGKFHKRYHCNSTVTVRVFLPLVGSLEFFPFCFHCLGPPLPEPKSHEVQSSNSGGLTPYVAGLCPKMLGKYRDSGTISGQQKSILSGSSIGSISFISEKITPITHSIAKLLEAI